MGPEASAVAARACEAKQTKTARITAHGVRSRRWIDSEWRAGLADRSRAGNGGVGAIMSELQERGMESSATSLSLCNTQGSITSDWILRLPGSDRQIGVRSRYGTGTLVRSSRGVVGGCLRPSLL
jgi:hypothetical protein